MEIDYKILYQKMLEYWREHDGLEFDVKSLRECFNADELACILFEHAFEHMNYSVVYRFKDKVRSQRELFNHEEADRLFGVYPEWSSYIAQYCSNEFLYSMFKSSMKEMPDEADSNVWAEIAISNIDSDELLLEIFKEVKKPFLKQQALVALKNTELKMKYLNKLPATYRASVILSMNDDYLIEKYIFLFRGEKGRLISSLGDDKKKVKYLKMFYPLLSLEEKSDIINSFKDDQLLLRYLKSANDYMKSRAIIYRFNSNPEMVKQLILTIKNKLLLMETINSIELDEEYIEVCLDRITDQSDIQAFVGRLSDERLIFKYFAKLSYKKKIEGLQDGIFAPEVTFKLLKFITRPKDVIAVVEHIVCFPPYDSQYEYLLDIYAKEYNVDKNRLEKLIKNISFGILTYIDSENIIEILNAKEDEFEFILKLCNKDTLQMDHSTMNDILNAMLQRRFRMNHSDIILIFSSALSAIELNDRKGLLKTIDELSEVLDVSKELEVHAWSLDTFVNLLLNKDDVAIEVLHELTSKFIRNKRNTYVQEQLGSSLAKSSYMYCDKNAMMKYIIKEYPVEYILTYFEYSSDSVNRGYITQEEYDLLQDVELMKKIIQFKKNPSRYETMPEDVKNNIKIFNSVFEKRCQKMRADSISDYVGKIVAVYKKVDEMHLASVLMYVDLDKIRKGLFSKPEYVEEFVRIWNQYKIGGWGKTFNGVLSDAGLEIEPEIIANFIQYFGISYEQLKKNNLNITLTALLDLATCYSLESKKYSLLFGHEDFKMLSSNPGYTAATLKKDKRIKRAIELVSVIRNREYVTVPAMDTIVNVTGGKQMNVVVGNFSNMINLTYGERTDACMRIGGAGESLFDFCLENENGFHIRFVNPTTGKFVSRVSGFRNGNTVFLNQLRESVDPEFENRDVVEACKAVAKLMLERSKDSDMPIDNVVISPDYAMRESGLLPVKLGIDNHRKGFKYFYTDVGTTSILLATSSADGKVVPPKLGVKSVPRYPVVRDKKRVLYNGNASEFYAHLQVLDLVLGGTEIDSIDVEVNEEIAVCLAGEDWCVTIDREGKINKFIMTHSNNKEVAIDEMQEALVYLKDNLKKEMQLANSYLGM